MELHQLKYFVAVADEGNFSRAAERCYVSQPSLSQQIIKLESEIGRPLFDRTGRQVRLTDAGRLLLEHARTALAAVENASRQLKEADRDGAGRLAVGVIPTIATYLLPPAIAGFGKTHPKVELIIQEDYTQRLIVGLREGELDLGIAALPIDDDQLTVDVLGTDQLLLVLPTGHRLAARRRIAWMDLRGEPFVLINEMHCLGEQVISLCRSHAMQPRIVCRGAQISTVQALVGLGQGVSLLPAMARPPDGNGDAVYRELSDGKPERTIVALRHRHRHRHHTAQARGFLEVVKSYLHQ